MLDQKGNIDVLLAQARLLLRQDQPQLAIEVLDSVLKLGNVPLAHYLTGVAYRQMGDLVRAQSEMEAAIAADPGMTDAYLALGEMMLNRNLPQAALQYALTALQHAPGRADCLVLAGGSYAKMGDFTQAQKIFSQFAQQQGDSADALNRLASLQLMQKRFPQAIKLYRQALDKSPKNLDALDGLASSLLLQGNRDSAVQLMHDALSRGESAPLLSLAGKIYAEAGDNSKAEDVLKSALQMSSGNYAVYSQLGSLYVEQHRLNEATLMFESVVKAHSRDLGSWTMLGVLREQNGQHDKAIEAYNQALQVDPNAGVAANNLAWIYADRINDLDKALELARRAKIALPDVPNVSDTLGWVYARRQLNQMAVPLLLEAIRATPTNANYHVHLGVALWHSGKKAAARQEIATAIKLDGGLRSRDDVKEIMR
jgi:tetratricopeptide (TPR) repeat protein